MRKPRKNHTPSEKVAILARDFKEFILLRGMTHARTSPYYPQSNGKVEHWRRSLKAECIRPGAPLRLEYARPLLDGYARYYNRGRPHSAIGYITPATKLAGQETAAFAK